MVRTRAGYRQVKGKFKGESFNADRAQVVRRTISLGCLNCKGCLPKRPGLRAASYPGKSDGGIDNPNGPNGVAAARLHINLTPRHKIAIIHQISSAFLYTLSQSPRWI